MEAMGGMEAMEVIVSREVEAEEVTEEVWGQEGMVVTVGDMGGTKTTLYAEGREEMEVTGELDPNL